MEVAPREHKALVSADPAPPVGEPEVDIHRERRVHEADDRAGVERDGVLEQRLEEVSIEHELAWPGHLLALVINEPGIELLDGREVPLSDMVRPVEAKRHPELSGV